MAYLDPKGEGDQSMSFDAAENDVIVRVHAAGFTPASSTGRKRSPIGSAATVGGLGYVVAGPGSDLSEVPVVGVELATLDFRVVPVCPPGPVPASREPAVNRVGEAALKASHCFQWLFPPPRLCRW
jgi:hypothetical protein